MSSPQRARQGRAFVLALAYAVAATAAVRPLAALDKRTEAAAADAIKKAASEYSGGKYDAAMARLQKALKACSVKDRCSPQTKGALLRDVGTMQFRKGEKDASAASWGEALKLEPQLDLNPVYDAPDLRAAWEPTKDEAAVAGAVQPTGDFTHTPATEQAVRTGLPVFVEYSGETKVQKVVVKYKGAGMREYKQVTLAKREGGWGGLIPCGAVQRGVMRYYVQGLGADGTPVLDSGSAKQPFLVPIRAKVTGSAPSLPGASPPAACDEASARASVVEEPSEPEKKESEDKPKPKGAYARVWIGITGSIDLLSMPAATNVCRLNPANGLPGNPVGYYCTNPDGSDFPTRTGGPGENASLIPGKAGLAPGGITPSNVRVMLTADYAATANLLVGARLGYVFGAYPGFAASHEGHAFSVPIHLELRLTYLFGSDPLADSGVAPYGFVGAGISEFDAQTTVQVATTTTSGPKQAWITAGPGFAALGGGVRFAFTPQAAVLVGVRGTGVFGGASAILPTFAPELSMQYGF